MTQIELDSSTILQNTSNSRSSRIKWVVRQYAGLIFLSVIWGVAFVAIKALEPLLTPVNLTLLRWFLASAGFLVLAPFLGRLKTPFERKDLPRFLLVAFANVVSYHLTLNYSESAISAGMAVLLVSLGPVLVVVLSRIFLGERHGKQIIIAVVLAFSGAIILSLGSELTTGDSTVPGVLEAIGTALSFSVFAVFSKPLVEKYGPKPITIWSGISGTAMLLPLVSKGFIIQVAELSPIGWIAMLYLSLLSSVIGYMLFYTLVSKGALGRLSIQLYLVPIVGVVSGILLLHETVTYFTLGGGAAMLLSVAYATKQGRKESQVLNHST